MYETPLKVIKALYDYEPQGPGELRFSRGDFFHVLQAEGSAGHESNGWYEATNPITHQRGMVPMSYFEVFNKPQHNDKIDNVIDQRNPINSKFSATGPVGTKLSNQALYAIAVFDFKAERPDELDLQTGENLIICAHHDYEWFIAKPITRLGGPGLVPVSYVKIIDMAGSTGLNNVSSDDPVGIINHFQIPTVEEWKAQTAKYQALSIPLGQISQSEPSTSANSQFFQKDASSSSNRSSLSSSKTYLLEAGVDSYQLEHGRYQYSVVARLSNGKTRYLYRYYQDFYDLQVKLLEMFPLEAGKVENSRRIIPSIPGPLINVNDSISKLRREKLDLYLRGLIALPANVSRSEEVLGLFDVLENGYDREVDSRGDRTSKPVQQRSNYQQDRLSQYSNLQSHIQRSSLTPSLDSPVQRSRSSSSTNVLNSNNMAANNGNLSMNLSHHSSGEKVSKIKVKFYFEDDIFVLLLPSNLRLSELRTKLARRLDIESAEPDVHIFLKRDYDAFMDDNEIVSDTLTEDQRERLFQLVVNNDAKFQQVLVDKCKVVILKG